MPGNAEENREKSVKTFGLPVEIQIKTFQT
jgi:hypothetical protein